jgi:peptidoglycan/LPS O-acetylase OafA/YrhL
VVALLILFLEQTPTSFVLIGLTILALYLGYARKGSLLPFASGLLLYLPLAIVASAAIGSVEGCLASASGLVLVSERMSFENDLSKVLDVPTGVDAEASLLAKKLSSTHLTRLGIIGILVVLVATASLPLAGLTFYVPLLITSAVVLMLVVYSYSRRQYQTPLA